MNLSLFVFDARHNEISSVTGEIRIKNVIFLNKDGTSAGSMNRQGTVHRQPKDVLKILPFSPCHFFIQLYTVIFLELYPNSTVSLIIIIV